MIALSAATLLVATIGTLRGASLAGLLLIAAAILAIGALTMAPKIPCLNRLPIVGKPEVVVSADLFAQIEAKLRALREACQAISQEEELS